MSLWSTGASILGGILGYKSQSDAAKRAAKAQADATAEQKRQFDILQRQNEPFLNAQTKATNDIMRLADTTYNPSIVENQVRTELGRANAANAQQADMALTNRGLAGGALGAKMRANQSGVESGIKARSTAADTFMRVLSPILGNNAVGVATEGARALSSVAQNQANAAKEAAYTQNDALQGVLGPLGGLVEDWANKDLETRYQKILAETMGNTGAKPDSNTNSYGSTAYNPMNRR